MNMFSFGGPPLSLLLEEDSSDGVWVDDISSGGLGCEACSVDVDVVVDAAVPTLVLSEQVPSLASHTCSFSALLSVLSTLSSDVVLTFFFFINLSNNPASVTEATEIRSSREKSSTRVLLATPLED